MRFHKHGFTLVELSIVLVIIGLIVGGVLVGRDLISAAEVRATISQIEKYKTAANTFRTKYGYLPGDIPEPAASGFGFITRGTFKGQGDGNGMLEGSWANVTGYNRTTFLCGENAMFWRDLSTAGLVDGNYANATPTSTGPAYSNPALFMPLAKIGNGNYVTAYSVTADPQVNGNYRSMGTNYFGIRTAVFQNSNGDLLSTTPLGVTPAQAYQIDNKIDDGMPQTGGVLAQFVLSVAHAWASGTTASSVWGASDTSATPASPTTCFDNGNATGVAQVYSLGQNGGNSMNCALTLKAGF